MNFFYISIVALFAICNSTKAQTWGTFGSGADQPVLAMKPFNDGLIVGGNFETINSINITCLAYYKNTGSSYYWSSELSNDYKSSASFTNPAAYIDAIEIFDNRIHIGGKFYKPSYLSSLNIGYLTYDSFGPSWDFDVYYSSLTQPIYALKAYNNKLYLGGSFTSFMSTNYIAYANSLDYPSPFPYTPGNGLDGTVECLEVYNGNLYAGGTFTASGSTSLNNLAKWDGSQWTDVGGGLNGTVSSLTVYNNELIVGGTFTLAGSTSVQNIAKWNGSTWSSLGDGFSNAPSSCYVYALKVYNNSLFAGGRFNKSNTTTVQNIARWNGSSWTNLGTGVNDVVRCLEVADSKLFVGGDFTSANGLTANHIAHYSELSSSILDLSYFESYFSIMPNPSNKIITIETPQITKESTLKMYNINGQELINQPITGIKTSIDISSLGNGIYFVKLFTNNTVYVKKIIKE